MIDIADEVSWHHGARESLLDAAFGAERFTKTCERLREGRLPAIALSATDSDSGALIGTVRLWHVTVNGCRALLLGPLAVSHLHQGCGLGAKLMRAGLNRAAMAGHQAVILVGDAEYYSRFGFSAGLAQGLDLPGPVDRARLLATELVAGALVHAHGMVLADGAADPMCGENKRGPWGHPKLRLDA
ncbi:N-acetyltransferase [Breoghania sp. L-A4]|uniref:GNAT family N-acetyltransferase n=1 Tax=Breoghania sp. L-A4 TaxID=2304600 RepID=UPI000E35BA0D|nr:N-acetyltransferase [Breoghania sp. L-A4]AXS41677.1 N-acetyltransferase [Breoghania sp. L-A4]